MFQMLKASHYTISKVTFAYLIRKFFRYWEAVKFTVADTVFQNSNFCLKARIL